MDEKKNLKEGLKDELLSKVSGGENDGTAYKEYHDDEDLFYFYDINGNFIGSRPPFPGELDEKFDNNEYFMSMP